MFPFGVSAADFRWCVGIEDTFVPQTRPGLRALDEYALMGHYEHWREDLLLVQQTGARMIRWGIPWYRVEPEQGRFDWSWVDQVLPYLVQLDLEPIVDLVHYGTPLWLDGSFVDPRYPQAVASYARAVAERYHDIVRYYTPLNEPIVNAMMCGEQGLWPPYLRGEQGYVTVGLALCKGIVRTVRAIKEVDPHAVMIHVEAAGLTRAGSPEHESLATVHRHRHFVFLDLVTGRVDSAHPLYDWLRTHGISTAELDFLAEQAISLDVLGLNFYPQWSTKQISMRKNGVVYLRNAEHAGANFAELITDYYERYHVPIMITETSAKNGLRIKQRWLKSSVSTIRQLRAAGVPVLGYTWFPLWTMIDWDYRKGRRPLNDYLIELGLYESELAHDGQLRYVPTPLVDQFRSYTQEPDHSVGNLKIGT